MNVQKRRANPYVGPRPFKTGEKLYGRDGEVHDLSNLLIAGRIVLLYSPSGAGKSSLVQAGLIPGLLERGLFVHPTIRLSLDIPARVAQENADVNRYLLSTMLSLEGALEDEKRLSMQELPALALDEYLRGARERRLAGQAAQQTNPDSQIEFGEVLIFDQFEEVLTLDPTDQASKQFFFQQVGEALRDRKRWALFVLREDFLAALDPYLLAIPTRFSSSFRLDFLGAGSARQAIQNPAINAGVEFDDKAAGKLVDDLRRVKVQQPDGTLDEQFGPYIEPVQLQVVCSNLWEKLKPESRQIALSDLAEVGDVDQSLGEYYASKVQAVAFSTQVPERSIREWFENELITEQGFRGQVLMGQVQSEGLDNRVIRELVDTHLVRAEKRRGLTWYELTHDRLIGPLRKDNQRWFEANLSLLQRQASLWELNRQADHLLLRDEKLKDAEAWAAGHESELTSEDRNFLKASQEAQQLRDQAVELEIEKQRAEERARRATILRRLLIVAVLAAILAVFLAITAYYARQDAIFNENLANIESIKANNAAITANTSAAQAAIEKVTAEAASTEAIRQKATADSYATQAQIEATRQVGEAQAQATRQVGEAGGRLLAAQALGFLGEQPDLSSLLAIEAYKTAPLWESKNVLLSNIQRGLEQSIKPYSTPIPQQDYDIYRVALSPDGVHIAWGDYHGNVVLRNYQTGEEKHFRPHIFDVRGLAFSPDGKKLASSSKDGTIVLTDVTTGQSEELWDSIDWAYSVAFDPKDGTKLAAGVGNRVIIWDINTGEVLNNMPSERATYIFSVVWSPDGNQVAASSYGGEIRIWNDLSTYSGHGYNLQNEPQSTVHSLAWSPDGHWLVSAHQDGKLILWDVINSRQQRMFDSLHKGEAVFSVSISSDGKLLASGGGDNSIVILKMPSLEVLDRLDEHRDRVQSVAFIPDNNLGLRLLASGGIDNRVKLFEISSQQPLSTQIASGSGDAAIALTLSSTESPRSAILKNGSLLVTGLDQPLGENVTSAAFNLDGTNLAVGQENGRILVFDSGSGALIHTLEGNQKPVLSLAYNAQGSQLASGICESEVAEGGARPSCAKSVIQFWDPKSGQALFSLTTNVDYLSALAFYPLGDVVLLATGSYDGSLQLWNPYTRDLKPEGRSLVRFSSGIASLAFSPDGRTLASGRTNGTLILWDATDIATTNPKPIGDPLLGSPSNILSMAFSNDSQTLYSGDEIGNLLAWDISPERWIERNCNLAKRNLTKEEWEQYLPNKVFSDQPERMTCPEYP
jgi:WD40 repeat protein